MVVSMLGHIGGAPVEEVLFPLLASGTLFVSFKAAFSRATKRGKPQR
jgi:hypothetical protein